jgi:hypothetical protein
MTKNNYKYIIKISFIIIGMVESEYNKGAWTKITDKFTEVFLFKCIRWKRRPISVSVILNYFK